MTYDTLLHGKALLVIAASDAEDLFCTQPSVNASTMFQDRQRVKAYVALPFITQAVGWDFVAHALLHEDAQLAVIFDLDKFLRPIGRVGDVQLHLVSRC